MFFRFLRREEGQTLGIFSLVVLALVVAIFFVYNVGDFFIFCIKEQNAVDAAALSMASLQANALNDIVKENEGPYIAIYTACQAICWACCACCGPWCPCCCSLCPFMAAIIRITEWAWRIRSWMIVIQADMQIWNVANSAYKDSGGSGFLNAFAIPLFTQLDELKPSIPKCLSWQETFCGLAEKKRQGSYNWAGMVENSSSVGGSYKGYYDKKGPKVYCQVEVAYHPVTFWFQYSKKMFFKAGARPYGGNVHPRWFWWGRIGNGKASFTAKLVPFITILKSM
ncbi:MAG: hypothetical protein JW827_02840 [Spirochaetes bacterium]|nr:hypothetical protein [Spirochaetota bacterium]